MTPSVQKRASLLLFLSLLGAVSCGDKEVGTPDMDAVGSSAGESGHQSGAAGESAGAHGGAPNAGAAGDGGGPEPTTCQPARSHEHIPQRHSSTVEPRRDTFANLSAEIEVQCGNCHKAPAKQGAFSYTGTRENICTTRGARGQSIAEIMLSGEMPYMIGGQEALGGRVQAWMDQGCPADTYDLPAAEQPTPVGDGLVVTRQVGDALTDLGNCIPDKATIGADEVADSHFAAMNEFEDLPKFLSQTDVTSFDSAELAKHGTIAFAPAYPLWSDNAKKLRFVHLPHGTTVEYDTDREQFRIPPNSRFYKTFFRGVVEADGVTRYRKMETRLIVTKESWQDALFGTYVWNKEETEAQLLGTGLDSDSPEVYLNNEPFPDYVRPYATDESTGALAEYPVPGAERCRDCHQGSESESFVLGFNPLQLNRRPKSEGGQYEPEEGDFLEDELSQPQRLIDYGLLDGTTVDALPKLEESAFPRMARGPEELTLQAYTTGNCGHCHNPKGFAPASNPQIEGFDLSPGGVIFNFDFARTLSSEFKPYFSSDTNAKNAPDILTESFWYRRVYLGTGSFNPTVFGIPYLPFSDFFNLHMPLHTSTLDCRLPLMLGRWWVANGAKITGEPAEARLRVEAKVKADCQKVAPFGWVLDDRTERSPYVPRNIDWRAKLDAWIRAEEITPEHEALAQHVYNQGYFDARCVFPNNGAPPAEEEFWMRNPNTGEPLRPWTSLFSVTPGEHIYAGICSNCHGLKGDSQTGAARAIRATSGGRVADFVDGLFGPRMNPGANLSAFDELGPDGAAKYLVWMANGGTNVSFGRNDKEEGTFFDAFVVNQFMGRVPTTLNHSQTVNAVKGAKANMLGVARVACDQLRTSTVEADYERLYAEKSTQDLLLKISVPMWQDVCTLHNPLTPELRAAASDSETVLRWQQKAVFNAGVMVYLYLRDGLSRGKLAYPRNACFLKYPKN